MSIYTVLHHRATVSRSTTTFVNGSPVQTWAPVAENVPCLLDARPVTEPNPVFTGTQQQAIDRSGTLFTAATTVVKVGDRVRITRPVGLGTYLVAPDPSPISDGPTVSHREFRVSEVPGP